MGVCNAYIPTCNFSRIDNATLNLDLVSSLGNASVDVYAVNYNVLNMREQRAVRLKQDFKTNGCTASSRKTAMSSNCGNILRALTTTSRWKRQHGTRGNDLGRNNVRDWKIRSQIPTLAIDRVWYRVQRLGDDTSEWLDQATLKAQGKVLFHSKESQYKPHNVGHKPPVPKSQLHSEFHEQTRFDEQSNIVGVFQDTM